jgi:hypothetical protein
MTTLPPIKRSADTPLEERPRKRYEKIELFEIFSKMPRVVQVPPVPLVETQNKERGIPEFDEEELEFYKEFNRTKNLRQELLQELQLAKLRQSVWHKLIGPKTNV